MSINIDVRDKDVMDDIKVLDLVANWNLPEDEDELPEIQKIILYLLKEMEVLKERLTTLEEAKSLL